MAWTLATGAAVTLSWWGVHTVVVGTVYDRPRALPITGENATAQGARPRASSTHRPPSPPPSPSPESPKAPESAKSPDPSEMPDDKPSTAESSKSPKSPQSVRSYPVDGGRVVFDLGTESAELVSATPEDDWQMQVWKQDFWIRVTFTRDEREISVFCTWHDSAPRVQVDER